MDKEIIIETQNTTDEVFKAAKQIIYKMPLLKYALLGIIVIILVNFLPSITSVDIDEKKTTLKTIMPIILVPLIWGFLIYAMIKATKKKILTNPKITEKQILTFKQDSFRQQGETYYTEYFWKDINKIEETKDWFFIYINKASAIILIKEKLQGNQYNELKALFNTLNIKKSLK